jgi:hypothetical protein
MRTRVILTASAVLVAAVVMLVTMWAGPKPAERDEAGQALTLESPPPPNIDDQIAGISETPRVAQVRTETYFVERYVRNRIWQFFGDSVTPLPNGLAAFEKPGARIFLNADQSRVIEVTADRGTFDMPDNQPRRGQFDDNVVVTYYDSENGGPVNFAEPGDALKLRLFLDSARFEQDIGQIESDGPVHLTGPRLDFTGTGLVLNFNQRRNRIERLEIRQGQELRFKPEAAQALAPASVPASAPVAQPPPTATTVQTSPPPPAAPEPAAPDRSAQPPKPRDHAKRQGTVKKPPAPPAPRGVQFYRAVFHDDVHITSPQAVLQAQDLEVIFSLDRPRGRENLLDQLGRSPSAAPMGPAPFAAAPSFAGPPLALQWPWWLMAVDAPALQDDSPVRPAQDALKLPPPPSRAHPTMAPPGDDDVVIRWTGPLEVRPLDPGDVPAQLAGPADQMLTLIGHDAHPARIHTTQRELIAAHRIGYTTADGQVLLEGTPAAPFIVDAPDLGVLSGATLNLNQRTAEGQVTGPGVLDTQAVSSLRNPEEAQAVREQRAQQSDTTLQIAWRDRLDMTFFRDTRQRGPAKEAQANPSAKFDRLRALHSARFTGAVAVTHPDFHLDAQVLAVTLDDPNAGPLGRQQLTAIDAEGDVVAVLSTAHVKDDEAPSAPTAEPARLQAQRLNIGFADRGDGHLVPDRLLAGGDVRASEPGQTIQAQEVEVEFTRSSTAAPADAQAQAADDRTLDDPKMDDPDDEAQALRGVAVKRMRAQDDVKVTIAQENVTAQAQRLIADPITGQVDLFGQDDIPARLTRSDGALSGVHLTLQRDAKKARADGPGRFVVVTQSPNGPGNVDDLTILWTQAMEYDHAAGVAQFHGSTSALAQSDTQRALLTGEHLRVTFATAAPSTDSNTGSNPDQAQDHDQGQEQDQGQDAAARALRRVEATGDPVFLAESFAAASDTDQASERKLASRFRLAGPSILFDHPTQQVQVLGAGTMLVEDYRWDHSSQPAPRVDASEPPQAVALFGAGQTLFTWTGSLHMDLAQNDLRLADGVQMVHRSAKTKGVVQLDCQKLLADLTATGGLEAWTHGQALQPRLHSVRADGGVMVREGNRQIRSDELTYDGSNQSVLLTSTPPRVTQVVDVADPLMSMTSEGVRWWLASNRLEVIRLRAGRVPLQLTAPAPPPAPAPEVAKRRAKPAASAPKPAAPPSMVPHRPDDAGLEKSRVQKPPPPAAAEDKPQAKPEADAQSEDEAPASSRPPGRRRR